MHVITATWETEFRRIKGRGKPRQMLARPCLDTKTRCGHMCFRSQRHRMPEVGGSQSEASTGEKCNTLPEK
jgi:hypothetical protein